MSNINSHKMYIVYNSYKNGGKYWDAGNWCGATPGGGAQRFSSIDEVIRTISWKDLEMASIEEYEVSFKKTNSISIRNCGLHLVVT